MLSNCVNSGIRRIGVLTQYAPHSLIRHLQYGWNFLRHEIGEFVAVLPAHHDGAHGTQQGGTAARPLPSIKTST